MYCRKCGKKIEENSKFCPYCGYELKVGLREVSDTTKQNMQQQKVDNNASPKKLVIPVAIMLGIVVVATVVFLGGKAMRKPEESLKAEIVEGDMEDEKEIVEEELADYSQEITLKEENSDIDSNGNIEEVNTEVLSRLLYILGYVDYKGYFGIIMTLSQEKLADDFLYYTLTYAEDIMRGNVTPAEENWVLSKGEIAEYLQNSLGSSERGGAFVISDSGDYITIGRGNPSYVQMIENVAVTDVERISDTEIKVLGEMIYRQDDIGTEEQIKCQLTMVKNPESVWSGYTIKSVDSWDEGISGYAKTPEEALKAYTEQVIECRAEKIENIDATHTRVISNEKISVNYGDGTEKVISQRYGYICELTGDGWLLTSIEKVD